MAVARTQAVSANTTNVAISAATAGDLILVFAYNSTSTTIPSLPAGFTNVLSGAPGGSGNAVRVGYKIATGGETSSGTWTNATNVACHVYSGARAIGSGMSNNSGNSTAIGYTSVTMEVADGTSWLAGFAGAKSATAGMNGNTTNLTNRTSQTTINGLDSGAGKTSSANETLNVTTSGRWIAVQIEIKAMPVMTVVQGAFALTGQTVTLTQAHKLPIDQGAYALTGQVVGLKRSRQLPIVQGAYAFTGQATALLRGLKLGLDQGAYALNGQAVTLTKSANAILVVAQGSFSLNGQTVALLRGSVLSALQGAYALTGQSVAFRLARILGVTQGGYALTGEAVALSRGVMIGLDQGAYALTGQVVGLLYGRRIPLVQGSFVLNGQVVGLRRARIMSAVTGFYALTGQAVALRSGLIIRPAQGAYALNGQAVNFRRNRVIPLATGYFTVTGQLVILNEFQYYLPLNAGNYPTQSALGSSVATSGLLYVIPGEGIFSPPPPPPPSIDNYGYLYCFPSFKDVAHRPVPATSSALGNPYVNGMLWRMTIALIDYAGQGVHDWGYMDECFDASDGAGKIASIQNLGGQWMPPWFYSLPGVQLINLEGIGPTSVPWDPLLQAVILEHQTATAARYGSNANLKYVVASCIGEASESFLALEPSELAQADALALAAGYSSREEAWEDGAKTILGDYHSVWAPYGKPVVLVTGSPFGRDSEPSLQAVFDWLRLTYGAEGGARPDNLTAQGPQPGTLSADVVTAFSPISLATLFQMANTQADAGRLLLAVINGITLGAHGIEIFPHDLDDALTDPETAASLLAGLELWGLA